MIPVPAWVFAVIAAAFLLIAGGQQYRINSLKTEYAEYVASVATAAAESEARARATEHRLQEEANAIGLESESKIKMAEADAAASRHIADSLHGKVSSLLKQRAGLSAAVTERGETIRDLSDLLAELFKRADQRAGELAKALDASRIAGLSCQARYDSIAAKK